MIGAGVQARAQLLGLSRHFKIEQVKVFDTSQERSQSLETDGREFLDCEYLISAKPQEACECDILVTTTTSRSPVVKESWILPGTHINAIGADAKGKQELQSTLIKMAKVFVDDLAGKKLGRENDTEITIFDSTGLCIQDVATGFAAYEKALQTGRGMKLPLA